MTTIKPIRKEIALSGIQPESRACASPVLPLAKLPKGLGPQVEVNQ